MEPAKKKHSLMLDSRSNLVITGAEDVNGFNEETVSVRTTDGTLIIKGSGLHIDKLNLETGDVSERSIHCSISARTVDSQSCLGSLSRYGAEFCPTVGGVSLVGCFGRVACRAVRNIQVYSLFLLARKGGGISARRSVYAFRRCFMLFVFARLHSGLREVLRIYRRGNRFCGIQNDRRKADIYPL